ncbi:Geranylgeranyl transferase type-2 subunit beta [Komagataella phaffii CBS 7435]|nr:Geranylgeranyl transferase type-2 subunit beta [Komagataella phaffii CBS 7435]CCA39391.1 Geranylgeranyl transferase type-2 subunit beta [Komagataella phaffii CBS 7435]
MSLHKELHRKYIQELDSHKDDYAYWLTEHLRMNGLYWGITALFTLKYEDTFNKEEVIDFVLSCWDDLHGGFGAFPRHDSHILSTLSAVQILKTYGQLDILPATKRDKLVTFVKGLQLKDGSFEGDRFGEVDTRFVYTGLSCLSILGELTPEVVDPAVEFIAQCSNFDGAYGMVPGAESHAAQVFVCVAALAIANRLDLVNKDMLIPWLSERQVKGGGLNGRPEKLPDVCYSWWVLSSLSILQSLYCIDQEALRQFIYTCQDAVNGGISDRPDNQTDVYHTLFGIAGLSLMGFDDLEPIDPVYCMPKRIVLTIEKYGRE